MRYILKEVLALVAIFATVIAVCVFAFMAYCENSSNSYEAYERLDNPIAVEGTTQWGIGKTESVWLAKDVNGLAYIATHVRTTTYCELYKDDGGIYTVDTLPVSVELKDVPEEVASCQLLYDTSTRICYRRDADGSGVAYHAYRSAEGKLYRYDGNKLTD